MTLRLAAFLAAAAAAALPAQQPDRVRTALAQLQSENAATLELQSSICEIPAPPFGEGRRAAEFKRRLEEAGLRDVRVDSIGNVIGEWPGTSADQTAVVLSAHLDTVFPESTDVRVRREGGRLLGPGIQDDCRGLAALIMVARVLGRNQLRAPRSILFVGTVGEEGAGNLRGVRYFFESGDYRRRVHAFISVDHVGLKLTRNSVGSHRYRVTFSGPGGHSYNAFGMPNPVHAAGRALARIAEIQVPADPKATFSAGVVRGGTTVNSIVASAGFDIDLRSVSPGALNALDAAFRAAVHQALEDERRRWPSSTVPLEVSIDTIGIRPAGAQPLSAPIVQAALATARQLGFTPEDSDASTDANIPMSLGVPALAIGHGGRGEGEHTLGEWYEDGERGWLGPQWVLLLAITLAGLQPR